VLYIHVDRVSDIGPTFGDIDGGRGVQAEPDGMVFTRGTYRRRPAVVDGAERIGAGIELHVDEPHLMPPRPLDGFFERQFQADIDPNALAEAHRGLPRVREEPVRRKRITRNVRYNCGHSSPK